LRMENKKTRILIYEDNDDFRDALRQLIDNSEKFECAGHFRNCSGIIKDTQELKPSVVLMDIDLPVMKGIEGLRLLQQTDKDIKVIMLTVFDDNKNVMEAIVAGAAGYLLKANCLNKLFDAIEDVLNGGAPMSSAVARMVLGFIAQRSTQPSQQFGLTAREHEVLSLLVKGYSYKMIAASAAVSIETIKTHIRNIYEKLQVHNQSEAVAKALRNNLIR